MDDEIPQIDLQARKRSMYLALKDRGHNQLEHILHNHLIPNFTN